MNHKNFISIKQVWERLDQIPSFRTDPENAYKPGLERVEEACRRMGNPQQTYRSIHVAGTNGKGSLCTALGAIYEHTGLSVGVYTSPHLIAFNERIKVNGKEIPDEELLEFFNSWDPVIADLQLSYFELATCISFWWFQQQGVDLAMLETGLGGRLDATNVVLPELAVISSIDYDHTEILGDTISDIAREKAGIIKKEVPVLMGHVPREAESVIRSVANETSSRVYQMNEDMLRVLDRDLVGQSQFNELCRKSSIYYKTLELALAAIWIFENSYSDLPRVNPDQISQGLKEISDKQLLPARFERLHADYNWFFDGAHTPEAIDTLLNRLKSEYKNEEAVLIFALMKDRAVPRVVNKFSEFSKKYYYEFNINRSAKYSEIAKILPDVDRFPSNRTARLALLQSLGTQLVIFGGSFYFYSIVREWMSNKE